MAGFTRNCAAASSLTASGTARRSFSGTARYCCQVPFPEAMEGQGAAAGRQGRGGEGGRCHAQGGEEEATGWDGADCQPPGRGASQPCWRPPCSAAEIPAPAAPASSCTHLSPSGRGQTCWPLGHSPPPRPRLRRQQQQQPRKTKKVRASWRLAGTLVLQPPRPRAGTASVLLGCSNGSGQQVKYTI